MQRFYSFRIVTYNSIEIVESFVKTTSHYAYALHDKDLKDDGSLQPEHFHILATFVSNKSFEAVRKLIGGPKTNLVKAMTDKFGDYLYLTHKNAPDKYQYSDDIIVSNSKDFFTASVDKSISNDEFINDISPYSMLSKLDLARKYGRDYIKNSKVYHEFAKNAFAEQCFIERGFSDDISFLDYNSFLFDLFVSYLEPYYKSHLPSSVYKILSGELPPELGDSSVQKIMFQFSDFSRLCQKN